MGERGRIIHVRGAGGATLLDGANVPCALLAINERWTSLVPLDSDELDLTSLATGARSHLLQVWFDDDAGVVLQAYGQAGLLGEMSVVRGTEDGLGIEDQQFIDKLVKRDLLTPTAGHDLKRHLTDSPTGKDAWIDSHGVEACFDFPFTDTVPHGAHADRVLMLVPGATIVQPTSQHKAEFSPKEHSPVEHDRELPPEGHATLNLHVHYWTHVWTMNNWTLYNQYKKRLPPQARHEADELANAVAMGQTREIEKHVQSILVQVWEADDWDAVIRSPSLDDIGTDEAAAKLWRQMTGRAG